MFVLRFFEMILFIASVGIAGAFTRELFADLFRKTLKGSMASLIENVWLYGDFICALLMLALAISILQGSKKAIRILSWLVFVPILVLAVFQQKMLVAIVIAGLTAIAGIWLSYRAKV